MCEARLLTAISGLGFLQFFYTTGWVTERSACKNLFHLSRNDLLQSKWRKTTTAGTGKPRFNWNKGCSNVDEVS